MKAIVLPGACLIAAALAGCAAPQANPPAALATLAPPAGEVAKLKTSAAGTQIYECRAKAGSAPAWVFLAPDADLYDDQGRVVGRHYAGPTWELPDGSRVKGEVERRADGTAPGSIPWLLLGATSTGGPGQLAGTTSIQRIHTRGGAAPKDGCTPETVGQQVRVYYTTDYVFFAKG
jgi:Protein of unknown function (DUF3455)